MRKIYIGPRSFHPLASALPAGDVETTLLTSFDSGTGPFSAVAQGYRARHDPKPNGTDAPATETGTRPTKPPDPIPSSWHLVLPNTRGRHRGQQADSIHQHRHETEPGTSPKTGFAKATPRGTGNALPESNCRDLRSLSVSSPTWSRTR